MTNHSATLRFLLAAALVLNSGMFVRHATCKFCTDGLGECDNEGGCSSACTVKHPGGEGSCEIVESNLKLCYCHYNCEGSQPSATICKDTSLGVCECQCDQECSAKCEAKHPGGKGSCSGLPLNLCQCLYLC